MILRPNPERYEQFSQIRSDFSFGPFIRFLESRMAADPGSSNDLYHYIIGRFKNEPHLLRPGINPEILERHTDLLQLVSSFLFSMNSATNIDYYHLSTPYRLEVVHQSEHHADFFSIDKNGYLLFDRELDYDQLMEGQEFLAYRMILRKYYHYGLAGSDMNASTIRKDRKHSWKYYRILMDESFIDFHVEGALPPFPAEAISLQSHEVTSMDRLRQLLPLGNFRFEGFIIRKISDITFEQSTNDIKNCLIDMHSDEAGGFEKLQKAMATFLAYPESGIGIIPFIPLNGKFILSGRYAGRSILLKNLSTEEEKEQLYNRLGKLLQEDLRDLVFEETALLKGISQLHRAVQQLPYEHYAIHPLQDKGDLLGMLEIGYHGNAGSAELLSRLTHIEPFLLLAMRSSIHDFQVRLDKLMKETFTSLQPSVEWKFAEHAYRHLRNQELDREGEIDTVEFSDVYPIYGIVDIRNSSVERGRCIQKDLVSQLAMIDETVAKMKKHSSPAENDYLNNLLFKNRTMRERVSDVLLAEDELRVNEYLEHEVKSLFRHFSHENAEVQKLAESYLQSVDPVRGHLFRYRRDFDDAVRVINSKVAAYLEMEDHKMQKFYPHYFEKFRTDGIEYNIFIGESIASSKPFDYLYLKNLRLWQLSAMAEITRITNELQVNLPLPLYTTQLILVHSNPICVTFRNDERKFDVEGGANVRYELIKKRIDKVKVRETGERLTQPGKVAIVYMQAKEAEEYEEYIHFLKKKSLFTDDIEKLELEDVQGLSGLKAIRVSVLV